MKKRKNKAQQAVAAVVMGMNLVNTMSPLALAAQAPVQPEAVRPAPQAQPLEYTVLPQVLQAVEGMVFARAEAENITVSSGQIISVQTISDNNSMVVNNGGVGIIDDMGYGGNQLVSYGGIGSIVNFSNNGAQSVYSGGTGYVETLNAEGAAQHVDGGNGSITVITTGYQSVYSGGVGSIETMNGGDQGIWEGVGTIENMNGGAQNVAKDAYGYIGTMNEGRQRVSRGGIGNIETMKGGNQSVGTNGIGIIETMSGGTQHISNGGVGSVGTMYDGAQRISAGTGIIDVMSGGNQSVDGVGSIGIMYDGAQFVASKGNVGIIGTMNGGKQELNYGGNGSIGIMNNGQQSGVGNMSIDVMNGGLQVNEGGSMYSANIGTMNGGSQVLTFAATGNIGVMNDGEQQIGGTAVGIISSLNGGTQILNGASATAKETIINGGTQLVQNGTAQDNTVNGGTQIISGGVVSDNTVNAGVMLFEGSGAKVNDVAMNGGEMLFGSAAAYSISALKFNGGTVDLTENASADYQTLTLENYSGNGGTFKLDADFEAVSGDKVVINNANNAAGYIQVNGANIDASAVSEDNPLLLVTVNNGSATFTGKSLNGGGLYEYNPEIAEGDEINQNPNEFYLTGLTKNVNNDTLALLDGIDNSYAMWRNTNDTLRKRLGEIHTLPSNDGADGVWARYIGGKFDGGSYEGQYNLYQLGYDKNYDAKSIIGFALEKGGGNATYSFGSGEDDLFAGAVYGSWLADDGSYTDVVAKIGRFDTELNSYGDFPDSADYRHNAYSLSVEYGKKISLNKAGLYLEPQAQFIAGRLDSVNYTTDRGTKVSVDGINSYIGRVGVMFDQQLENGSDVYIKANLLHEFGGESSLAMLAANGDALTMEKDYGDTWYELGIGANIKIGRASYFYGDIERGFGGDIDKKWQINAGLRFEF